MFLRYPFSYFFKLRIVNSLVILLFFESTTLLNPHPQPMNPILQQTLSAIGKAENQDYILDPASHAELYEKSLPELAATLKGSNLAVEVDEYKRFDQQAIEAQKRYKKYSYWARVSTFVTAIFSSALLMSTSALLLFDLEPEVADKIQRIGVSFFSLGGLLLGAGATIVINWIRNGNLLEDWMKARSNAEEHRLGYFDQVANLGKNETSSLALAKLEYFRRYQLEIQKNYYEVKSTQLKNRGRNALLWVTISAGIVAVLNGLAGAFGADPESSGWTSLAGLALMVQAYSLMLNTRELSEQNQRNASRYENTRRILARLYGKLDEVRSEIIAGQLDILPKFVEAVHEPISTEHRQWLEDAEKRNSAISRLDEALVANKTSPK